MAPEESNRSKNIEAYRTGAVRLRKLYPNEFIAILDGQFAGHHRDSAELISEIRERGIGGMTLSLFHTGSNVGVVSPTTGDLCPNCNAALAPSPAIFCSNCGYHARCRNCMHLRPIDATSCPKCGRP